MGPDPRPLALAPTIMDRARFFLGFSGGIDGQESGPEPK